MKITFKIYFLLRSGTQEKEKLNQRYIREKNFSSSTEENTIFFSGTEGIPLKIDQTPTRKHSVILKLSLIYDNKTQTTAHLEFSTYTNLNSFPHAWIQKLGAPIHLYYLTKIRKSTMQCANRYDFASLFRTYSAISIIR
jgi:hypothetical protein